MDRHNDRGKGTKGKLTTHGTQEPGCATGAMLQGDDPMAAAWPNPPIQPPLVGGHMSCIRTSRC